MNKKKFTTYITVSILSVMAISIYVKNTAFKSFANNNTDASVTYTTQTNVTTNNAVSTARKAPVSIKVYSDTVTESADTYDYSSVASTLESTFNSTTETGVSQTTNSTDNSSEYIDVNQTTTTSAPALGVIQNNSTNPAAPQSTAAPGTAEEPDMISYPPTQAPAYSD
jgi:hypothetical protein